MTFSKTTISLVGQLVELREYKLARRVLIQSFKVRMLLIRKKLIQAAIRDHAVAIDKAESTTTRLDLDLAHALLPDDVNDLEKEN